jgi:hypothetical protein
MDVIYHYGWHHGSTDDRLVGDDNEGQAQFAQGRQAHLGTGKELELIPALYVISAIFADHAISVNKYRPHSPSNLVHVLCMGQPAKPPALSSG